PPSPTPFPYTTLFRSNGTIPGPTIRANVGDTLIVHYTNNLDKPSAIHWHGIELPNAMDGTPFTQNMVEPGGSFLYKFKLNRPGRSEEHTSELQSQSNL